ncbi:hypothetical protein HOG16_02535 [Candidatus Woesearchaeota archaeon]|jgi:hypothetical protein|nr:hypothetical protein [Candidatus Woesearchaeota archaeon]MBT4321974.1 hypothetical protein [Candidatus Woesearchaeota archaeon]MBT4631326.1 hypothetical protein [Candidatus Woesearchaeota archaeon]
MKKITIFVIILILIILGLLLTVQRRVEVNPVGGERDENGCLGPAGYSYNEDVNACLREWELNENQKDAAKIAVEFLGYEKGITIIEVVSARCPGCFVVEIEKGKDRIKVTLEDWEVKETSLTPEECENFGGRIVNVVGGDTCLEDEKNVGDVTGFISPNICCVSV